MKDKLGTYDDIMNLPHPISNKHPQMSNADRAAQFAPFAALPGHKECIIETERLTTQKKELDANQLDIINNELQFILKHINCLPHVAITSFILDAKKNGGKYVTIKGNVKKIDEYEKTIIFINGYKIPIHDIYKIQIL